MFKRQRISLMERAIIQGIKKLRVLTPYDYDNMDELVQDLASALEETSCSRISPGKGKKGRSWKRRSKSTGNLVPLGSSLPKSSAVSGDSESSLEDRMRIRMDVSANGSHAPSDSDEVSSFKQRHLAAWRQCPINLPESDSVNENFLPVYQHRRKRKFKRMAVDHQPDEVDNSASSLAGVSGIQKLRRIKSVRNLKNKAKVCKVSEDDIENLEGAMMIDSEAFAVSGKRKRSMRERSVECIGRGERCNCHSKPQFFLHSPERREHACSSSSFSSSESDCGIVTNDEGREADDEQSDFFHETGPVYGVPGGPSWWEEDENEELQRREIKTQEISVDWIQHMSRAAKEASYQARIARLAAKHGREIRAGRRRLGSTRPSFSIVSSMNEKISSFMQNPLQNELRLQHLQFADYQQLNQLAALYSLDIRQEGSVEGESTLLLKTRHTTQAVCVDPAVSRTAMVDIKRQRRTPPVDPSLHFLNSNFPDSDSIPVSCNYVTGTYIEDSVLLHDNWQSLRISQVSGAPCTSSDSQNQGFQPCFVQMLPTSQTPPPPPPPSPQPGQVSQVGSTIFTDSVTTVSYTQLKKKHRECFS
ncbi:G patch domain-containing protein 2-like isoform X1 [Limulus polyphemus]|uniref:G patch domain-containing protein 2-like isoform X1 n=1 Tax=Limulus polyphemus TaxID=6850 RepID=A0ABM1SYT4_LIMPO|nr:G patch domain-containing protein 2-like isoform X1 [Limulus polyphemus]XP_022248791.1 G patch domain-containing protein 2-like isoform X1 [Limulus polyphemus]XP_022248792.1 G patch domain-containing protein 2-like isoform X1 [Limulus polyphemus]XP_022248793.1 G patch domain-containing protein 2-like isoform X1 [Limulus polyphemus]